MANALNLDMFDKDFLEEMYDSGSIARGRAYATENRVRLMKAEPGLLSAMCRGSGRQEYLVSVTWEESSFGLEFDDHCSCPIGGACKHCIA